MPNQQGQNYALYDDEGPSNENSTAVEEIYLPPQLGGSKWQKKRGSGAGLDTTGRYTVDMSTTRLQERTLSENKRPPRKANLSNRSRTVLCKLWLSEAEIRAEIENDTLELVRDLGKIHRKLRVQAIQSLPVSCQEKKDIRNRVLQAEISKDSVKRTCWTDCLEQSSLSLRRWWLNGTACMGRRALWHGALKDISRRFGTAILAYFRFVKWLLNLNVFLFVFNLSFITMPEIVHMPNRMNNSTFEGLELLTGTGYFDKSVMFYGGYSGEVIKAGSYHMQLAYFFSIFIHMLMCGLFIVYSLGKCVWKNMFVYRPATAGVWRLLSCWDFSILNEKAIHSFQKKMFVQMKESLSDEIVVTEANRLRNISMHIAAWLLYIGVAFFSCTAVYILSAYNLQCIKATWHERDLESEAFLLLLPTVVSVINLVVPLLCALISQLEHYDSLRTRLYAGLARDVLLKMSILGILCYYWLINVPRHIPCWESFVGQDVYRMAVADFVFSVLRCVFGEYLWSFIWTKCAKSIRPPEFDLSRNVLDLIYAQTLVWIGVYFSPLLPVIQIAKLLIIFYMKKASVHLNCCPSTCPGIAAETKTAFVGLIFFPSFVGSLVVVCCILWSLKPSAHCGPFRGLDAPIDAVSSWLERTVVSTHHLVIPSKLLLLLLSSIILIMLYFLWQVVQDRKRLIGSLREQIVNEGKDKASLLEKLRRVQGARPQVRFLDEEAQSVKRSTAFKEQQQQRGWFGPRGNRRGSRPAPTRPPAAENTRAPQSSTPALATAQPPPAVCVEPPQQPQRLEQRPFMARGRSPPTLARKRPSVSGERQPESPEAGRGSRVECWTEESGRQGPSTPPSAINPPPPHLAWGSTSAVPPRFPRLEPIIPRQGQPPLPGAVPENPRPINRTPPRPKFKF